MKIFSKLILFLIFLSILFPLSLHYLLFSQQLPLNLGINYTKEDIPRLIPKKDVVTLNLNSSQSSALLNSFLPADFFIKNIQVKINSESNFESSGLISFDQAIKFLYQNSKDINDSVDKYHLYAPLTFYLNANTSITDGKLFLKINKFQIGKLSLPQKFLSKIQEPLTNYLQNQLAQFTKITVQKLDFQNSNLNFIGKVNKIN